ncbi:MAG: flagellar motor protein MotB [Oceanicoccus sp.]|uniref:flagellar motor protein MotB n=1 Tax=Oceanicoccus sp. TaxID=2691044 RepID=UPI0026154DB5|nr:flagellar motor protein MotB [Oceanicoccus sp.]MDG1772584.1 flagellar motor protein MotB [Oceanicoccus sp.]
MSDEEANCPECPPPGAPSWMATFADLMSLLMCFFVLLLSFSEMDAMKFKRLAGSMAQAFGVQNKLDVKDPPKGTSIIAQEFSPGRPDPTPINQIYQHTDDLTELSLEVNASEEYDVQAGIDGQEAGVPDSEEKKESVDEQDVIEKIEELIKATQQDARELAQALQDQIIKGEVEVETQGRQIIVRIREKGSFASGSAELAGNYLPLLQEMRDVLSTKEGDISIQGHTDDIPIKTSRFRSNWELSTSRAVSVAHAIFDGGILNPNRVQVSGFAATKPLASNETIEGRAKNRRVEIVIQQGLGGEAMQQGLRNLKEKDPEFYQSLELEPQDSAPAFNLDRSDIF